MTTGTKKNGTAKDLTCIEEIEKKLLHNLRRMAQSSPLDSIRFWQTWQDGKFVAPSKKEGNRWISIFSEFFVFDEIERGFEINSVTCDISEYRPGAEVAISEAIASGFAPKPSELEPTDYSKPSPEALKAAG